MLTREFLIAVAVSALIHSGAKQLPRETKLGRI